MRVKPMPAKAPDIPSRLLTNLTYSALWLVLIMIGFAVLLTYQTADGDSQMPPQGWPGASSLRRSCTGNTVLLFLHPKCPCSRATLNKFAEILSHHGDTRAYAVFIKPNGAGSDWDKTNLIDQAQGINHVTIVHDDKQSEMSLFKAITSGLILNYNIKGNLNFAGGITPGRGHEGDSLGADQLDQVLTNKSPRQLAVSRSSVYGCPLEAVCQRTDK